jgi:uncharacterized protein (TIGR01244 family)
MDVTWISDDVAITTQVYPDQMPAIAKAGFKSLINNRPEHESPDQPAGHRVEEAAEQAGLAYRAVPLNAPELSPAHVNAMGQALRETPGPHLAFCRSGTRSYLLWALDRAREGADVEQMIAHAADNGYDISVIRRVAA